jgi:6-phosphogluconolactonase
MRSRGPRFVPLFRNEAEAAALSLDVVVLGMGTDGHTASFFPGGDTLAEAIDPHTEKSLIAITAPGSGEPRLTFTLPKLLAASTLCLHIEGEEKLRVLEEALSGDNAHAMPIRAVLASAQPLSLYWCP